MSRFLLKWHFLGRIMMWADAWTILRRERDHCMWGQGENRDERALKTIEMRRRASSARSTRGRRRMATMTRWPQIRGRMTHVTDKTCYTLRLISVDKKRVERRHHLPAIGILTPSGTAPSMGWGRGWTAPRETAPGGRPRPGPGAGIRTGPGATPGPGGPGCRRTAPWPGWPGPIPGCRGGPPAGFMTVGVCARTPRKSPVPSRWIHYRADPFTDPSRLRTRWSGCRGAIFGVWGLGSFVSFL